MLKDQDQKNWIGFLEGDKRAFSELYLKYHPLLLRYGCRLVQDPVEAEDAVQELFCYLYEKRLDLSIVIKVKSYLYLSYRRRLLQKISSKRQLTKLEEPQLNLMQLSQEDVLIKGEHQQELNQHLKELLADVTPNQREVIYLRYYADMENKEIARVLGIRHQSILNILYRGFKKLRALASKKSTSERL